VFPSIPTLSRDREEEYRPMPYGQQNMKKKRKRERRENKKEKFEKRKGEKKMKI
jgi:hypothetical protein